MEKIKGLCRAIFIAALVVNAITWPSDVLPHEKAAHSAYEDLVGQYQQICDKLECKEDAISAIISEQDFQNGITKQDLVDRMLAQFQSAKYYEFYTDETLIQVAEQAYEIYVQKKTLSQDEIYHKYVDAIRLISAVSALLSLCILLLDWLRTRSKKKVKKKTMKQEIKEERKEEPKTDSKPKEEKQETIKKDMDEQEIKKEPNEPTSKQVVEQPGKETVTPMAQSIPPLTTAQPEKKQEEVKQQEEFDLMRHVEGLRNWKVEAGAKRIDYLKDIRWDTRVIDHIVVDDFKVNLMRPGTYDLFYHILCKGNDIQTITKKYQVEVCARQERMKQEPTRPVRPNIQERPKPPMRPQPKENIQDPEKTIVFNKIEIAGNGSEENKPKSPRNDAQKSRAADFFLDENKTKSTKEAVKIMEVDSNPPHPTTPSEAKEVISDQPSQKQTIPIEDGTMTEPPKETKEPAPKPKEKQGGWFRKKRS